MFRTEGRRAAALLAGVSSLSLAAALALAPPAWAQTTLLPSTGGSAARQNSSDPDLTAIGANPEALTAEPPFWTRLFIAYLYDTARVAPLQRLGLMLFIERLQASTPAQAPPVFAFMNSEKWAAWLTTRTNIVRFCACVMALALFIMIKK